MPPLIIGNKTPLPSNSISFSDLNAIPWEVTESALIGTQMHSLIGRDKELQNRLARYICPCCHSALVAADPLCESSFQF